MRTLLIILVVVVVLPVVLLVALSDIPVVRLDASVTTIGRATPLAIAVSDPHGVRHLAVSVEQNGASYRASEITQPAHRIYWRRGVSDSVLHVEVGTKNVPELKDGKARLIIEATSDDFLGKTARVERDVTVATQPPTLTVDSDEHYLYLGMADLVTFNVGGYWTEAGVRVGKQTFRGWPMPDGKPGLFSLFAYAWNMPPGTAPIVYATNPAGNEVTAPMAFQFPKKEQPKYRVRDLQIDDRFMEKVTNELDPNGSGDLVTRFVKINSEMRRANNKTLSDLRLKTEPRFLWSEPFLQQHNSKVESNFADVRNYIYHGNKIDQQVTWDTILRLHSTWGWRLRTMGA